MKAEVYLRKERSHFLSTAKYLKEKGDKTQ
jgi:hypothetical protein